MDYAAAVAAVGTPERRVLAPFRPRVHTPFPSVARGARILPTPSFPPVPVRVFHLIKSLGRGGAEVLLAEGLAVADRERFGYGYGYFLPWKDAVVNELKATGAEVICFEAVNNARILLAARRVATHLRSWGADVVHAHLPVAGVVARLAGRMAGVPVVYTEHNLMERYHPLTRRLNLATWGMQARAIAVSGDVEESIHRHTGGRDPVQTVLNGVNVQTYCPSVASGAEVRERFGIAPEAPVVGTIAVFRTQKKLDHWMRVARAVLNRLPDTRFIIVGEGPERPAVEAALQEHRLEGAVHLAGFQDQTRPFFAAMDVYLMSSQFEGLPVALLEAMAMGIVPVVTSVGGIPELVEQEISGCLRPFGDVPGLAEDTVRVLEDDDRRRVLSAAARSRVVEGFSMERMQRDLESIYEEVIAEHRAA